MNIHEHQAKQILKKYGATVPEGVFALTVDELVEKAKLLNTKKYVLKAQIHAGGRGKAGGVKILDTIEELSEAAKEMMGKTLVTHQTGPEGREVKRAGSDIVQAFTYYGHREKLRLIGKNGVEKIEEINLDEKEKKEFKHSIDAVKALWEAASKIDPDLSK